MDATRSPAYWRDSEIVEVSPRVRRETGKRRTVAQLLNAARERAEAGRRQAQERAERGRVRREEEARAARERYLNDLAKQGEEVWVKVDQLIATKQPRKYDQAVTLLKDLRDLATRDGKEREHSARLGHIQKQHEGKPSLIGRLRKAGLLDSGR
jgi:hypothetical protein